MPDYSKSKIYVIRSHLTDDVYVGSTVQSLSSRMASHRSTYQKSLLENKLTMLSSHKLLCFEDAFIELIEPYSCGNKRELLKREGFFVKSMRCVNTVTPPGQTLQEYKKLNQEHITRIRKQYVFDNYDKLREANKEWRINHAVELQLKAQQYKLKNKEQIKQTQHDYYILNKQKLSLYKKKKNKTYVKDEKLIH